MADITVLDMPDVDLMANDEAAEELRQDLKNMGIYMANLMGAPSSGRTAILTRTIEAVRDKMQTGVICADIDTEFDAIEISQVCQNVVQMHTSGAEAFVHAQGAREGLMELIAGDVNLVFIENVGGIFSPVIHDTGAGLNVGVMSVTDGENYPLKYSFIFMVCDVILINKADLLGKGVDIDIEKLKENIKSINENARIFVISAKSGEGMDEWENWLIDHVNQSMS